MTTVHAKDITQMPVSDLIPYDRNPNIHSNEQIVQLANSIREWGFTIPILIDEKEVVLAGHGRLFAAKSLGMETVPCIIAKGWSDPQKKAYVIADNKLALNSGWDEELLKIEMGALDNLGFDLSVLGFNEVELSGLYLDVNAESFSDSFELDDGDKPPFQQITFTLADEQAKIIKEVLVKVKASEQFSEVDTHGNENSNGNLLFTLITQSQWAEQKT